MRLAVLIPPRGRGRRRCAMVVAAAPAAAWPPSWSQPPPWPQPPVAVVAAMAMGTGGGSHDGHGDGGSDDHSDRSGATTGRPCSAAAVPPLRGLQDPPTAGRCCLAAAGRVQTPPTAGRPHSAAAGCVPYSPAASRVQSPAAAVPLLRGWPRPSLVRGWSRAIFARLLLAAGCPCFAAGRPCAIHPWPAVLVPLRPAV